MKNIKKILFLISFVLLNTNINSNIDVTVKLQGITGEDIETKSFPISDTNTLQNFINKFFSLSKKLNKFDKDNLYFMKIDDNEIMYDHSKNKPLADLGVRNNSIIVLIYNYSRSDSSQKPKAKTSFESKNIKKIDVTVKLQPIMGQNIETKVFSILPTDSLETLINTFFSLSEAFDKFEEYLLYDITIDGNRIDYTYYNKNRSLADLGVQNDSTIVLKYYDNSRSGSSQKPKAKTSFESRITVYVTLIERVGAAAVTKENKIYKISNQKSLRDLLNAYSSKSSIWDYIKSANMPYSIYVDGRLITQYDYSKTLDTLGVEDDSKINIEYEGVSEKPRAQRPYEYYPKQEQPQKTQQPAQQLTISPYYILGIPDKAGDAQILGLTREQLRDKSEVTKAYRKLALIWHPDKRTTNEIANKRYSDPELLKAIGPDPDGKKIKALSEEVFKLIANAYDRNN